MITRNAEIKQLLLFNPSVVVEALPAPALKLTVLIKGPRKLNTPTGGALNFSNREPTNPTVSGWHSALAPDQDALNQPLAILKIYPPTGATKELASNVLKKGTVFTDTVAGAATGYLVCD
tara:strand:- start:649 stop:1008 length:360 start_codon:yes stop_codon:yes gene_type:complete